MAAPTNTSAATAAALSLPDDVTQTGIHDAGTTYDVWYGPITPSTSNVYSFFPWGGTANSGYQPKANIYQGPAAAPTLLVTGSSNRPVQYWLDAGTEYFVKIVTNSGNPTPATLRLQVEGAPSNAIQNGDLFVNDDTEGFPLAVLSASQNYTVRKFLHPAPNGENGDMLPNNTGTILIHDAANDLIKAYNRSFTEIGSTALTDVPDFGMRANKALDQIFVMQTGSPDSTLHVFGANGLPTGTTYTITGISDINGIAVSNDGTKLYWATNNVNASQIRRWDLSGNAALADLAASIGNSYHVTDLLVLEDDTILALYNKTGTVVAKRYQDNGTLLNTYTLGANATTPARLAYATDATAFWAWTHLDATTAGDQLFQRIRVSDGTVLGSVHHMEFEIGQYNGDQAETPIARFGNSFSCPFWVMQPPTFTPAVPHDDCPCADHTGPGAPLDGGGHGKSGPLDGGTGWTPGALCAGGGTVNSYPTASAGESMVGVRDPRIWGRLNFQSRSGGVSTPDTAYWSQDISIPDASGVQGGRKDGRALAISRISRSLSDDNGNYVGSRVTLNVNDKDRAALRTRLGSQTGKYVWNIDGSFFLASETNRRTGYAQSPREIFRGKSRAVGLDPRFTGRMEFEDALAVQLGEFGPDRSFSSRLLTLGQFPMCPRELVGKPQQWIFGEVSDVGAMSPPSANNPSVPSEKGLIPLWYVGSDGGTDLYHLCGHATGAVLVYGSDGEDPPSRVLIDYATVEVRDILDTDTGLTHRHTLILVPSGSEASEAHKAGRLNMAANACGVLGANGLPITGLFLIYQYIFEHIILPTQESLTGEYVGSPQWADGRYMVHSDSFADAQAYTDSRIPRSLASRGGYQGGFVLGGPAQGTWSLRDLLKRMSVSGDCWFPWTHAGQLKCVLIDDAADVSASPQYGEPEDLREMPTPEIAEDEVENPVLFSYDYDDDKQRFRVAQEQAEDTDASDNFGMLKPSPSPIQMRCVRDPATARDVAARRLLRRKYPPAYYPVVLPIDGVDRDLGDIIRITSQEGTGSGSSDRALWVKDWSFDPKTFRTTLRCRDLTDIIAASGAFASGGAGATYNTSTTDERRTHVFWAAEDGTVPTGGVGKEWR